MINTLVLSALILATYTDIKNRTIANWVSISLVGIVFMYRLLLNEPIMASVFDLVYMLVMLITISLIVGYLIKHDMPIGGGDIKLISAISFSVGFFYALVILLISQVLALISAVIYRVYKRQSVKSLPLAPFLLIGFLAISNII